MKESVDCTNIDLPEKLDSSFARELYTELNSNKDTDIRLDGRLVHHVGGLCLQVLIAAKDEWRRNDLSLELNEPSDVLKQVLSTIGKDDFYNAEAACP